MSIRITGAVKCKNGATILKYLVHGKRGATFAPRRLFPQVKNHFELKDAQKALLAWLIESLAPKIDGGLDRIELARDLAKILTVDGSCYDARVASAWSSADGSVVRVYIKSASRKGRDLGYIAIGKDGSLYDGLKAMRGTIRGDIERAGYKLAA